MTTVNITTSSNTININNNADQTVNPNMDIPTKVCNKCRTLKYLTEFYKDKSKKDGYHTQCKICRSNNDKEYVRKNKDKLDKQKKEYREQHKAEKADYDKQFREINKDSISQYKKIHYDNNKDTILQHIKEYNKNKMNTDPLYKMIKNNRARIHNILNSNSKTNNIIKLLGCNKQFFNQWIKFNLRYDMSYEEFKEAYHIDHVVALANFDLSIPENEFIAYNWQNCAPLLKHKNLTKGARRNIWSEIMQELKVRVFLKLYYPDDC